MGVIEVANYLGRDKLALGVFTRASSGGSAIPSRREGAYKWNDSARIDSVSLVTTTTGSYDAGSEVEVFGRS